MKTRHHSKAYQCKQAWAGPGSGLILSKCARNATCCACRAVNATFVLKDMPQREGTENGEEKDALALKM